MHRSTARVLPVDPAGRVLLLRGWDPARRDAPFWFTIGGATDPGETLAETAARELHEEVGITAAPDELGAPIAELRIEFVHEGRLIERDQAFFVLAVVDPEISFDLQDADERATIGEYGWWTPDDLEAAGAAAHPSIPDMMRAAVRRVVGVG